jgi:dimethylglycine dehydrogenase
MMKLDYADVGTECSIDILGKSYSAKIIEDSPYDPKNERLRDVNNANE